jgi:tetratricopeptide (TPR) repeat protein
MKYTCLLFLLLFSTYAFTQSLSYEDQNGNKHLLGNIERSDLEEEPYLKWFEQVYDSYNIDSAALQKINQFHSDQIEIKIYLGTWCGDSKREVSRFYKILDQSKIEEKQIELIALDNRSEKYKQGPNREEQGLNIHRVPTFVFYENGEEIARIVESPANSLEKDIAQIYAGLAPSPNYLVANYMGRFLDNRTITEADSFIVKNTRYFKRRVKNEGELNTMGYVLLAAKEIEKARVIFKLNTLLFPESSNAYDSLAEAYKEAGDYKKAIEYYMKSYALNPDNDNALQMIQEMVSNSNS